MARVLLYTGPVPGHVYPPVATAVALRERGHEVAVRTAAASVETMRGLGLDAAPIDPRIEAMPQEDWKAGSPIAAIRMSLEAFERRAAYEAPDLQRAIEAERPDLLWIDISATGAAAVAEASGLPWAHYLPYPLPRKARGVPAFGLGLAPSTSLPARIRDELLDRVARRASRSALASVNARRASFGLAPFERYDDLHVSAPLTIEFSAEPFEYPREWPASVRLVGPAIWEPPAAEPGWLAVEERPIVLVTASTEFQDDAKLIANALAALADRPYAVIATCAAHDPARFDAPPNARVEQYLPHGPILRRAACVVSHGGMGTTQKALAAGVPVCAVPFMRDQFEVARRLEHCGAGARLPAKRLRPDRLRAAVEQAIACRAGAERVREAFARAGGPKAAATALEELERSTVKAGAQDLSR